MRRPRAWPTSSWSTWWLRRFPDRRRRRKRWSAPRRARSGTTRFDAPPEQPALPRARIHAARGSAVVDLPHLSAGPRHVARLHRYQDRPRRPVGRAREFQVPHRRQRGAAIALQHAFLHGGRERHQVRARVVAGAPPQSQPAVQVVHPRDRAAALHRSHGAFRARLLVALRRAVLGHLVDAHEDGPDPCVHRFSRRSLERAPVGDRGEHLARRAVRRDLPPRGAPDHRAVAVRSGGARRRDPMAALLVRDAAAPHADHRGRNDVFRALHLHRFPADLRHHARRSAERDAPDGDAFVPARDFRRLARRGRRDRDRDGAVPPRRDPLQLLRPAAARLAARGRGQMNAQPRPKKPAVVADEALSAEGMGYLESIPRRVVTLYVPLAIFLFVLLFPFYWMVTTSLKPNAELLSRAGDPFCVVEPTLSQFHHLIFETPYPEWMWNTVLVSVVSTFFSLAASVLAAYAIERLRFKGSKQTGLAIFLAYLVPPSILFIPLAAIVFKLGLFDTRWALILTYPTFLIPFCTWLLMGYFRTIPYELEECALIDGATRWQILVKIVLPLAVPGLISAGIFAFTLSCNEFISALTFVSSSEVKTVPVGVITERVEGDVYHWGSLMAGAGRRWLPARLVHSFLLEYYVSGMIGAVKE